jgi:hypothetical protein
VWAIMNSSYSSQVVIFLSAPCVLTDLVLHVDPHEEDFAGLSLDLLVGDYLDALDIVFQVILLSLWPLTQGMCRDCSSPCSSDVMRRSGWRMRSRRLPRTGSSTTCTNSNLRVILARSQQLAKHPAPTVSPFQRVVTIRLRTVGRGPRLRLAAVQLLGVPAHAPISRSLAHAEAAASEARSLSQTVASGFEGGQLSGEPLPLPPLPIASPDLAGRSRELFVVFVLTSAASSLQMRRPI